MPLSKTLILLTVFGMSVSAQAPQLRRQGTATQLVVDGRPFLILGGELRNSSSSSLDYMNPIWKRMLDLHMNTVLAGINWELVEPQPGQYDFRLVDGLIEGARRNGLRLVFLWFGSWKNGMSSYVPLWVKQDYKRFERAQLQGGQTVEVLSTVCRANWEADARAFGALMRHIRQVDGRDHTVLMVQVENEVGVLGDSRDRSSAANQAFGQAVPKPLADFLSANKERLYPDLKKRWEAAGAKTSGTWEQVFGTGPETDEIFMAWNYASYVEKVAAAGKAEYPIPLFVNAWLSQPDRTPGAWPSGGPLPHVMDVWRAATTHIDILSPDIYQPNFAEWCRRYVRNGNALFIPEMMPSDVSGRNFFHAIGQFDAIGTSPFAVDMLQDPANTDISRSYALLAQVAPLILEHQGKGEITGFVLDKSNPSAKAEMGGYELDIKLDSIFGFNAETGYGLIIATGPGEFLGVGMGAGIGFTPKTAGPRIAGLGAVDEGKFTDGRWIPGRRLNGDETDQGKRWRFEPRQLSIQRCLVYRYE
jgi:beta-galactosidase GanA